MKTPDYSAIVNDAFALMASKMPRQQLENTAVKLSAKAGVYEGALKILAGCKGVKECSFCMDIINKALEE